MTAGPAGKLGHLAGTPGCEGAGGRSAQRRDCRKPESGVGITPPAPPLSPLLPGNSPPGAAWGLHLLAFGV